jgi:uncharacterized protein YfdQ (DUF2303 family)
MTTEQNTQAVIDVAREAMDIDNRITEVEHPDCEEGQGPAVPVVLVATTDEGGTTTTTPQLAKEILAELDARMAGPRRRAGTVVLTDVPSFVQYLARYQRPEQSVVYADINAMKFEALIDEHPISEPSEDRTIGTAWRGFRAQYACPRSPEWIAWCANDGKPMRQDAFGDFIEARLEDLDAREGFPKPLDVLQIARKLQIHTKGTFQRDHNPTTGEHILVHKTEHTSDSTQIPRAFGVTIPVFEGGTRYMIEARVRFTIGESGPAFSYTLHRRPEVERDAFGEVRATIETQTKLPVLSGRP